MRPFSTTDVIKRIESHGWIFVLLVAAFARWFALDTVPPGIKYDASSNGVYALNVLFNHAYRFYINPSGAPEPLMVTLQSISIFFLGVNVFAMRFVSGTVGVVVVALLYALAKETTRDRRTALVAAFALAVAVEPINLTRTGMRVSLVTLFETAWLLWFWRGWRTGRWRDMISAGAILGLGAYSYIATLAVPVVGAGLWLHQFLFDRSRWHERLRPMAVMLLAALVFATPRLVFQISYPSAAAQRVSQVSILQNPENQKLGLVGTLGEHLLDDVRMFGIEWQSESINVLRRPLLDPFLFSCFLLGLLACLKRFRDLASGWAPLTLAVMLVPDLLGANEVGPNELRTVGVLPPTFFLVGVGTTALLQFASRRRVWRTLVPAAVLLALAVGAVVGLNAYFVDFANKARNGPDEDYSRMEIAEAQWITRQNEPVFLSLNEYARSPVHFLVGQRTAALRSAFDAASTFAPRFFPARAWVLVPIDDQRPRTEGKGYVDDPAAFVLIGQTSVSILPPLRNDVKHMLLERQPTEVIRDSLGSAVANAFRVDEPSTLFEFKLPGGGPPLAQLSNGITLVGGSLDNTDVEPGEAVGVSLFWRASRPVSDDEVIFAHVLNVNEDIVVGTDVIPALGAYPTYLWKPGELVATHHMLKVPGRAQPGKYTVEIGMYNILNEDRLDVLDASGKPADSRVIMGSIKISTAGQVSHHPSHIEQAEFDHALELVGFDAPAAANPGSDVAVTLYWQCTAPVKEDYTVFVHLLDASGKIVAQRDHQPQDGQYPTSIWAEGDQVADRFSIELPPDLPSGRYQLEVGWYDWRTGRRLTTADGSDHLILDTTLQVGP